MRCDSSAWTPPIVSRISTRPTLRAAGGTVLYLGFFSLSDRRADRYIFPVYSVVGACGAIVALRLFAPLRRLAERLDRRPAVVQASLFLLLFALHIAGGLLRLPTVKLWPPDS